MTENINDAAAAPGLSAPGKGRIIYLIRHGKTEWNNQFRYQGATDVPLNDEGRSQAERAALRFAGAGLDAVFSSPLQRARETAAETAGPAGMTVEVMPELTEINFGGWEGLTVPRIKERYGEELFQKWRANPLNVQVPEGEEPELVWRRAIAAARKILQHKGRKLAVFGHGAMFRVLFPALLAVPRSGLFWRARLDNCSISAFSADTPDRASLSFMNDTLHLSLDRSFIALLPKL